MQGQHPVQRVRPRFGMKGGGNLLVTVAVSAITAFIITRIMVAVYFVSITKYTDDMMELSKKFYSDLIAILDKRM